MLSYLNPLPSLPEYTGPHKVGSAEYEIPISALSLGPFPKELPISTIRFRTLYPTIANTSIAKGVSWLPEPQTTYVEGYLKMARLSPWLSSMLLSVPLFLRTVTMSAYGNAPLAYDDSPLPVLIFSHGLVGNMNTHSAILGELASHGEFCVALEHRDGSGALSLVRNGEAEAVGDAPTEMSSVYFKRISLQIRSGVLEERDKQLQIRIFELMAVYRALKLWNEGKVPKTFSSGSGEGSVVPKASLNLKPSSIIWAGHSFGGTTVIQLLKSIYHSGQENLGSKSRISMPGTSLLLQRPCPSLIAHITPLSPVVLLDPWFMPLKSPSTQWLFCKPLPCHNLKSNADQRSSKTVVVMSTEFAYRWPECHSHMPAITSSDPSSVKVQSNEEYEAEFKNFRNPRDFINKSKKARAASASPHSTAVKNDLPEEEGKKVGVNPIASFMLHDTTHITHSDFGLLFQWLTWWFTGQKNPELAVQNIVRCVLRAAGLETGGLPNDAARAQLKQLS